MRKYLHFRLYFLVWMASFCASLSQAGNMPSSEAGNMATSQTGSTPNFFYYYDEPTESGMSENEIRDFFVSLATPSPEKMIWYRWGSGKFERQRIGAVPAFEIDGSNFYLRFAGKGLYVAESPASSAAFGEPYSDAEVVSVCAPPGTLLLDLGDLEVRAKMREKSLFIEDVFRANPPVMVKFRKDWWVLKSAQGVKIKEYSGKYIPTEKLFKYEREIGNKHVRAIHHEKIKSTLDRRIFRPGCEEVIPNPKTACEPCEISQTESWAKDKITEYFWRYDGTCGRYVVQDRNIALVEDKVNFDHCRGHYATSISPDGTECVKEDPRIIIFNASKDNGRTVPVSAPNVAPEASVENSAKGIKTDFESWFYSNWAS
jgi:hypothetical protein